MPCSAIETCESIIIYLRELIRMNEYGRINYIEFPDGWRFNSAGSSSNEF
jgi:hypothetical protein